MKASSVFKWKKSSRKPSQSYGFGLAWWLAEQVWEHLLHFRRAFSRYTPISYSWFAIKNFVRTKTSSEERPQEILYNIIDDYNIVRRCE
jgi:hypothetical protein